MQGGGGGERSLDYDGEKRSRQEEARTGVGRSIMDVDGWICMDDREAASFLCGSLA
jgi:hypothetical protein